jgi:hypothetical protein
MKNMLKMAVVGALLATSLVACQKEEAPAPAQPPTQPGERPAMPPQMQEMMRQMREAPQQQQQ